MIAKSYREGSILAYTDTSLHPKRRGEASAVDDGPASRRALGQAILQTVAYSDVFDYPLTAAEIHRYLIGVSASRAEVDAILADGSLVPDFLSTRDGFFTIAGREEIIATRRQRTVQARDDWGLAFRFGRVLASLPFVRMVAVTGELAMDNVGPGSDIDYFIVTEPGRLWLSRLLVVAVVRYAALRGPEICPNYFLSENALVLDDRNLYTAHEVAQMVPISGLATYRRLCELNPWVLSFLPNAAGPPRSSEVPLHGQFIRKLAEVVLRTRPGARVERWEMHRKVRKLTGDAAHSETAYSPDWCKGHVDGHGQRVLALVSKRWQEVKAMMQ